MLSRSNGINNCDRLLLLLDSYSSLLYFEYFIQSSYSKTFLVLIRDLVSVTALSQIPQTV